MLDNYISLRKSCFYMDFIERTVSLEDWYLLRCKHNQDERAAENLARQGLLCYFPKIHVNVSNRIAAKFVLEPLFPGYIFIRLDKNANWTAIRSTRGVLGFVRFGLYPTIVPNEVVNKIAEGIQESEGKMRESQDLMQGTLVRVVQGCFEGLEAIYKCKSGSERSIIFLNLLNKMTEVNIENTALERA